MTAFYDITQPMHTGMAIWPGDPPVRLEEALTLAQDGVRVSRLCCGTHTGTHIDAPAHVLERGATLDDLPLDALVGPAELVDVVGEDVITLDRLRAALPAPGERVLLRTRPGSAPEEDLHVVGLTLAAAQWLTARGVRLVGTDSASVDARDAPAEPAHRCLLGAGVVVVEGLALGQAPAGHYQLACLPLRLAGADGAPARAVLWREE